MKIGLKLIDNPVIAEYVIIPNKNTYFMVHMARKSGDVFAYRP